MNPPPPAPLTQVCATLSHAASRVATLPHVADLISNYLDGSRLISPARAAASGSQRLFQRVTARLFDATVDSVYREYALAKALEAAIQADDLAIVQAIHTIHPQRLDARSLQFVMAHGSCELVRWVIESCHDRVCCGTGVTNLCRGCVDWAVQSIGDNDTFRIASWLIEEGVLSVNDCSESSHIPILRMSPSGGLSKSARVALLKSAELVRWCDARGLLTGRMIAKLMRDTLHQANTVSADIVRCLLDRGYAPDKEDDLVDGLIAASCHQNQETLVELVLESAVFSSLRTHFEYGPTEVSGCAKVLQWDREYEAKRNARRPNRLAMASAVAGTLGHLATMKWLVHERGVTTLKTPRDGVSEEESLKIVQWFHGTDGGRWDVDTMDCAASNGHLRVLQWLHENRSEGCSVRAMDDAAANGHLEVVQWLHTNRTEGCTPAAMNHAAGSGHLAVVQWLYENRSEGNVNEAMAHAAANGELDVVRWCLDHGACARCVQSQILAHPMANNYRVRADFDRRPLYALRWLNRRVGGITCQCVRFQERPGSINLAILAVGSGDLLLAEYLQEHHRDLFVTWPDALADDVMHVIVCCGHLPAVQWFHARYPDSLDWHHGATTADRRLQTEIAEWLRGL